MNRLYLVIFLISFHLLGVSAPKGEDTKEETPTTSSGVGPASKVEDVTEPPATASDTQPTTETEDSTSSDSSDISEDNWEKLQKHVQSLKAASKFKPELVGKLHSDEVMETASPTAVPDTTPSLRHDSDEEATGVRRPLRLKSQKKMKKTGKKKNYWPKNRKIPHTGSLTPYEYLLSTIPDLEYFKKPEDRDITKPHANCIVKGMWTLFRHDIRYPSKETSHVMRTRFINLQESIILKLHEMSKLQNSEKVSKEMDELFSLLADWKVVEALAKGVKYVSNDTLNNTKKNGEKEKKKLTIEEKSTLEKKRKGADEEIDDAKTLTPAGKKAMRATGKRFKKRYGDLLKEAGPESRLFKFTDCERTQMSAREFYTAIYDKPAENEKWHAPIDTGAAGKDPLLKYDAVCGHWRNFYKKSDLNKYQLDSFIDGPEIKDAIEGIREMLQLAEKSITYSDGKMFYEACAFEMAWGHAASPWCKIMIKDYQARFEYLEDYEFFQNDGPDNQVNELIGCFLFKDMVKRLIGKVTENKKGEITCDLLKDGTDSDKDEATKTQPPTGGTDKSDPLEEETVKKATFYFTHLTAILKFITHMRLDVKDDPPLRVDNYKDMKNRKWRSARIGAFGTNISIVLMKCDDSYFILVLHQERPVRFPGYDDGLVPLRQFLNMYKKSISECEYDAICQKSRNPFFYRRYKSFRTSLPFQQPSASLDDEELELLNKLNE